MKPFISSISVLLILISVACNHQPISQSDAEKLNINGTFDLIDEYSYELFVVDDKQVIGEAIYFHYQNHFDENGNKTKDLKFTTDGAFHSSYLYSYDDSGKRIKEALYDANDTLLREIKFTYENDLLVYDQSYDMRGNPEKKYMYAYNKNGDVIKQSIYKADGEMKRYLEFSYNKNGQRIKEAKYNADKTLSEYYEYTYDEHNNVVKEEIKDKEDKVIQVYDYKYTYDDNGNWIQKFVYGNDFPMLLLEREIHYKE